MCGKVRESHFNHCGGHVKLVQACLNARGDEESLLFFFFVLFFYESLCKKKQGLQESIANEKYPNYKSPNKMTRKLILKLNL